MRWLARGGVGVALVAALALGRWIDDAWPGRELDVGSFERAAVVGDRVTLRYADLRLESVTATKTLATGSGAVVTNGTWLVIDVTLWAKREWFTGGYWRVVDARGRIFETDPRSDFNILQATPKVPWHVRAAFELPAGDLAGATLRISPAEDDRRDDVAVVDLGIDDDRAAELDGLTDIVPVQQSSSFSQPPLPGEDGYDDLWKDQS
ncbi:hypothetical protein [Nocardioides sp.]|uniref:hypothetical protein n=1 Tax=Nocardioides sp. TaxID=35761 RepID=UPI0039E38D07